MKLSNRKRQESAIAYHEAGHAVACRFMGVKVKSATIVPKKDEYQGCVQHESMFRGLRPDIELSGRARLQIERNIIISLAGAAAQRRHNKKSWRSYHSSSDFRSAANLASHVCDSKANINAFLRWLEVRTDELIAAQWPAVHRIAEVLLERKTVPGDEIVALILEQQGSSRDQQQKLKEMGARLSATHNARREQIKKGLKPILDPALAKIERAIGLKSPDEKLRAQIVSAVVRITDAGAFRHGRERRETNQT